MHRHLGRVVIDEMPDAMMRDAPELRPSAERADGRLLVLGEDAAEAQPGDIRKLSFDAGKGRCVHTLGSVSTEAPKDCFCRSIV